MAGLLALLAGAIAVVHFLFVVFAAGGALLTLRWPWLRVPHLAAVAWAVYIELSGGVCPLTPLENIVRARAGLNYYSGDFVARYLFPVLYPTGLTREAQIVMGGVVLAMNVALYTLVYIRRTARR